MDDILSEGCNIESHRQLCEREKKGSELREFGNETKTEERHERARNRGLDSKLKSKQETQFEGCVMCNVNLNDPIDALTHKT